MMKLAYLVRQKDYGWDDDPEPEEHPWVFKESLDRYERSSCDVKTIVWTEVEDNRD